MRIATTAQMKELDRIAIEERGVPSLWLMENAAAAVTKEVLALLAAVRPASVGAPYRVAVLCGVGNNGGDGLAAARLLAAAGVQVQAVLVGNADKMTPDARANADRLAECGIALQPWAAWAGQGSGADTPAQRAAEQLAGCDCVVDALFGVGLGRPLAGDFLAAVQAVNAVAAPAVCCDIPSGLHGDTGQVLGAAVRAAVTVTFTCAKPGLLAGQGPAYTGRLAVAEIGIPEELLS